MHRTLLAALLLLPLSACRAGGGDPENPAPGELYSVRNGEGDFKVVKVLAVEEDGVHVRLYRNSFPRRPGMVDPSRLTLGSVDDPDGFGIAHLPLSDGAFRAWEPAYLETRTVGDEELAGYRKWKEAGGGAFH